MDRLKGKVAVIVGGGQRKGEGIGNGRAISLLFAREKAKVMVVARHLESAQTTVDMIKEEGGEAFAYACDTTIEEDVKKMFAKCKEVYGTIDIMVNSVGILLNSDTGLMGTDENTFDTMTDVNLKAALFCNRHVYPYLKDNGGSIVQISSTGSLQIHTREEPVMYNLTKCALNKLGEMTAARYAADGIRCNTIVLGIVNTPMGMRAVEEKGLDRKEVEKSRDALVPLKGGQGEAWDTAYAALFFASDESKFITGAILPVDGGMTLLRG